MKHLFLSIIAVFFISQSEAQSAQTFGDAISGVPFTLSYDHSSNYSTRLYKDGVQLKDFSISEISIISTNTTTLLVTYKITVPAQTIGVYNFTVTSISVGSTGAIIESAPSNVCTMSVKPGSPGQLRKI